jgi:hypothetical protein
MHACCKCMCGSGQPCDACRRYIDDEIQARDIDSPFRVDGAIMGLFDALLTLRDEGRNITKLLVSVEMLAQVRPQHSHACVLWVAAVLHRASCMQANSRRGALAAALLPPLHWVMLGALSLLMMTAFLLFDSDFSSPVAENRTIFAVLSAMLVTILQVLSPPWRACCWCACCMYWVSPSRHAAAVGQ